MRRLTLLLALLLAHFAMADEQGKLSFRGYIDGSDILHIQGKRVWFEHRHYNRPGAKGGEVLPILINGKEWAPRWDGKISSPFLLESPLPDGIPLELSIEPILVRGSVTIHAHPAPANEFALALLIDDNANPGGGWYEFILHWQRVQ